VATLGGRIHLVGGRDGDDNPVDWHRAYDPSTDRWEKRAPLRTARWDVGAAELGGLLYVAGGMHSLLWVFSVTSDDLEAYDPDADAWTGCKGMHHARSGLGLAASAGRLYAIGGRRKGLGDHPSHHAEAYEPGSDKWKELDSVPTPRLHAALAELDGLLYLVGGDEDGGPAVTVESYVPGGGWVGGVTLEVGRSQLGLTAFAGRLLAVGGVGPAGPTASVEECRLFFDLHGWRKE